MRLVVILLFYMLIFPRFSLAATESSTSELGVDKNYGDWTEYCEDAAKDEKICNISQTLTRQGSQQLLLSIRVNFIPEKKQPLVFATLPLGGLLTYSPLLKVGKGEPLKLAYQFCDISGCTAVAVLDDETVAALKTETQAVVQYVNIARKRIGIPVSLLGFSKGLAEISKQKKE